MDVPLTWREAIKMWFGGDRLSSAARKKEKIVQEGGDEPNVGYLTLYVTILLPTQLRS